MVAQPKLAQAIALVAVYPALVGSAGGRSAGCASLLPARRAHLLGVVDWMVIVTSDGLPVRAEPQISEDLRERGFLVVKGLFVGGKVDQDSFKQALDGLLAVHSETESASLMRSLAAPVAVTPPGRRRQEPLEIATSIQRA